VPTSIQCPQCKKSLKVNDTALGKRVRCPACASTFLAVEPMDEVLDVIAVDSEEEERRPSASPRRDADDEADEEAEEGPPRPRRKRRRREEGTSISPPILPLVFAALAILFSCAPIVGAALGVLAFNRASAALDDLPGGRRAQSARTLLNIAKIMGIVGICLSAVMLIVAVVLNVVAPIRR
jgi:predicted Zn finger-like uncharacterized protein